MLSPKQDRALQDWSAVAGMLPTRSPGILEGNGFVENPEYRMTGTWNGFVECARAPKCPIGAGPQHVLRTGTEGRHRYAGSDGQRGHDMMDF